MSAITAIPRRIPIPTLAYTRLVRSYPSTARPGLCPGKGKAPVFAAVVGITRDSAHVLADLARQAVRDGDITKEARTIWGQYFRVDWVIPSRMDVVRRTIWEIAPGAEIPRLVLVSIR